MLPTFVIALREGLEAALIVGIIAAFLRQEGRRDALRPMWLGVGLAVLLCVGVGVGLRVAGEELPHREQEALEAIVAMVAVAMVTYMIVWMTNHAAALKTQLHGEAAAALERNSTWALVTLAFFAVLREGFETAVFLLAVFQDSSDTAAAGAGAVLGLVVAIVLGWAIYKGGVRINLARFFRITGALLVLVAAGLVASALHAAAEAGWVTAGQSTAFDLSWLVDPGNVSGALLTGMFGLQPEPTVIEVIGWLVYAIPMLAFVLIPPRQHRAVRNAVAAAAAIVAPVAVVIGVLAGGSSEESLASSGTKAGVRTVDVKVTKEGCQPRELRLAAGPANFRVTAVDNGTVTEYEILKGDRVLAEAESLTDGRTGTFSLTLQPGRYEVLCPGATHESGTLLVTGARTESGLSPELAAGMKRYRAYAEEQVAALVTGTERLRDALAEGDLDAARAAYVTARIPYERIEPIAEALGDLDPRIDARVNDVEPGQKWTGFHPIERRLWEDGTTRGTRALAARLVADARELQAQMPKIELEPAQVGNGANELLNEVSKSKITGEEERYSRSDLVDFEANVAGAQAAFDAIKPAVLRHDAALVATIDGRFDAVYAGLRPYGQGAKFVSYEKLTEAQVRELSRLIDQLAEPLSRAPALAVQAAPAGG
jgi:high-affinity iron transporter